MKSLVVGALALLLLASGVDSNQPAIGASIAIVPRVALVFSGSRTVLRAAVRAAGDSPVRWSLLGPGALHSSGVTATYEAPNEAGIRAVVVAAVASSAAAADVRTVAPPAWRTPLALVACFSGAAIDVRGRESLQPLGQLGLGGEVSAIAPASEALSTGQTSELHRRVALAVTRDHVEAIDLTTMRSQSFPSEPSALLTSVAALAGGAFAVTDANARAGGAGVQLYRLSDTGRSVRIGAVPAGETPEDVVAERSGRVFYVSNTNGNSVMRFAYDPRSGAKRTGIARTGTRPFGIAVDERHHLLFVADNDTPYVSGARSKPGMEVFDLPSLRRRGAAINTGSPNALPLGVAVDEAQGRVFVTNEGDASVAVFSLPNLRRVATFATARTPWLPVIDAARHRLLVPAARADEVDVFDTQHLTATMSFATCSYPTSVAVTPDSSTR